MNGRFNETFQCKTNKNRESKRLRNLAVKAEKAGMYRMVGKERVVLFVRGLGLSDFLINGKIIFNYRGGEFMKKK